MPGAVGSERSEMKRQDVLTEVKKAEAEARRLKDAAVKEGESILKEARRAALKILDEAKAEGHRAYKTKMDAETAKIEEAKERIRREGRARAEELKAKGAANMAKAVDTVVENFEAGRRNAKA